MTTLIEKALAAKEEYEARLGLGATGFGEPAPQLPLAQTLLLAIYNDELLMRKGLLPSDSAGQLLKAAHDSQIPEEEIQAALDAATEAAKREET